MERIDVSTVVKQFKRTFDERSVNELGKRTRLCRRERTITPFRLALSVIERSAWSKVACIADLHRGFNTLCEEEVRCKPFHNQLAKRGFAQFMRELLNSALEGLALEVLRFESSSPFCRFSQIHIQDGTSFGLKSTLSRQYPGRWTKRCPAAAELHVDMELLSERVHRVTLSADTAPERAYLPRPDEMVGKLLLADRGYYDQRYFRALDEAGAHYVIRGNIGVNPVIVEAFGPGGRVLARLQGQRLKDIGKHLKRYDYLDLTVESDTRRGGLRGRLIVHPNPTKDTPRYLVTNLSREEFSVEQVSDAYRLRWQIELLFKEWKSYANLHAFDTSNPYLAEGLIWAALCAATLKRFCAHLTQRLNNVAISTHIAAKCGHRVLYDIVHAQMHRPDTVQACLLRATDYLTRPEGVNDFETDLC